MKGIRQDQNITGNIVVVVAVAVIVDASSVVAIGLLVWNWNATAAAAAAGWVATRAFENDHIAACWLVDGWMC